MNILLVDDEPIVHETISDYLVQSGHNIDSALNGEEALQVAGLRPYDLALVDIRMPGMDGFELLAELQERYPDTAVVIITGHGTMELAINALRLGAADFLTKPIKLIELDAVIEKACNLQRLRRQQRHLRDTIRGIQAAEKMRGSKRRLVGRSGHTHKVRELIQTAVDGQCETVLITGETGTGKEVVAREIHFLAGAEESPFIAVSCPALPSSLVESELFGHVKGAFTSASVSRAGYFELAHGGTLFLDEIGDLSASAQASLLRVLETRSLRRIGGAEEIKVNIRVVAATNAPLEQMVKADRFRADLFYRLNVFSIPLLPLRERREDILPLADYFLENYVTARGFTVPTFSDASKELLECYDYPGNARELRNLVERAAILCRGPAILPAHLAIAPPPGPSGAGPLPQDAPSSDERQRLCQALETVHWNRRLAAQQLGMPYSTLRYKLKVYGIS